MRRDEAAKLLPIIKAFSEGKEIQYKENGRWYSAEDIAFFGGTQEFRIKPEPTYRPFKDAEEGWQEMQKHQPFGWLKIDDWYCTIKEIRPMGTFCHGGGDVFYYADMVKKINFADGTPFGVKVEYHDI